MNTGDAQEMATLLIAARGREAALSYATAQLLECELNNDAPGHLEWQSVVDELRTILQNRTSPAASIATDQQSS